MTNTANKTVVVTAGSTNATTDDLIDTLIAADFGGEVGQGEVAMVVVEGLTADDVKDLLNVCQVAGYTARVQ